MRRIPEERFSELIDAATEVFIERGYRRTQMSDVAEAVGVAKGTLYGYVESKEALFALCLAHADHAEEVEKPAELPVKTPPSGALALGIKERLAERSVPPVLEAALARQQVADVATELEGVLRESFAVQFSNRRAIKLIDRCMDHPELGAIWQEAGRETHRAALRDYFELRGIRPFPDPALTTRITIETLVTWAVHIHWDRAPVAYDPDEAREHVIAFLLRALLPRSA